MDSVCCELAVANRGNSIDGGECMKIFNIKTYGLAESLIRSGYPMQTIVNEDMQRFIDQYGITDVMLKRGIKLGNTGNGEGHSNFLKGIIVQADFHAPQYWWQQAQRYHWFDIVSSQSKMHRILEMDLEDCCGDTEFIDGAINTISLHRMGLRTFEEVLDNIPMGFKYTAAISTNYLQLKTMYHQRKNHRLTMWNKVFVEFCESLPYFKELCGGKQ